MPTRGADAPAAGKGLPTGGARPGRGHRSPLLCVRMRGTIPCVPAGHAHRTEVALVPLGPGETVRFLLARWE